MRTQKIVALVGLVAVVCGLTLAQSRQSEKSESIQTVNFCDLTAHPKLYIGKPVRVKATFIWWWESSYLYDSSCETNDKKIHNGLDCSGDADCERLSKDVYGNFRKSEIPNTIGPAYRSDVTIVGRLVGPRKSGFGHLGSFKFEFRIRTVESASPVARALPKVESP
jgi:hypothetical protein